MKHSLTAALLLGAAALAAPASAQPTAAITQSIAGTRLDINATGEVTRVPDIAVISAGVVTRSASAGSALQQAANRMQRVRAAFDPQNLSNPQKIFPRPSLCAERRGKYEPHPLEATGVAEIF